MLYSSVFFISTSVLGLNKVPFVTNMNKAPAIKIATDCILIANIIVIGVVINVCTKVIKAAFAKDALDFAPHNLHVKGLMTPPLYNALNRDIPSCLQFGQIM